MKNFKGHIHCLVIKANKSFNHKFIGQQFILEMCKL